MYFWRRHRPSKARLTVLPAALLMVSFLILPAQAGTPALKIKPGAAVEGSPIEFVIVLSAKATRKVKVHWQTKDGSAVQPGDYTASSGDALVKPGKTKAVISVPTTADPDAEADETFSVELSKPSKARIKTGTAVGTITNDDAGPSLAIENATLTEGNAGTSAASFTVSLSAPSPTQVTVEYATQDGTASSGGTAAAGGDDYEAANGTLTFLPGDTSEVANITVNGDTTFEGSPTTTSETFSVILSTPTGASVSTDTGTGTITNDDAQPTISIADVTNPEGSSAGSTTQFSFNVTLARPSAQTVAVSFATSSVGGTNPASSVTDYSLAIGTLTFVPGDAASAVTVNVNQDTVVEADETFFVNLSNPTNAMISDGQGIGVIQNDD